MKKYNEFVNEGLFSFFGNIFKSLMTELDKDSQKVITDNINAMEKTKNIKDTTLLLRKVADVQANSSKELKDVKGVQNLLKEDIVLIDMFLKSAAKKFATDNLQPKELYKLSKNAALKKIFLQKTDADFQKNLDSNIKELLLEVAKQGGVKPEYIEEKLAATSQGQVEEGEKNESILYEGAAPKEEDPNTTEDPNAEKENTQDPDFEKLKTTYQKFQKDMLWLPLTKKFDEMVKKGTGNIPNFDNFLKNFQKTTKNTDSVKKMILKLPELDKAKLLKIRDAQGLSKDNTPL